MRPNTVGLAILLSAPFTIVTTISTIVTACCFTACFFDCQPSLMYVSLRFRGTIEYSGYTDSLQLLGHARGLSQDSESESDRLTEAFESPETASGAVVWTVGTTSDTVMLRVAHQSPIHFGDELAVVSTATGDVAWGSTTLPLGEPARAWLDFHGATAKSVSGSLRVVEVDPLAFAIELRFVTAGGDTLNLSGTVDSYFEFVDRCL